MTSCVDHPGSLRELAADVSSGAVTATALVERYLDRIAVVQPIAEPWREVDGDGALRVAAIRDAQTERGESLGALHGVPIGIKDIIDVAGLPTRCNCKALQDVAPAAADAEVVAALKAAGAIVLGKLHTTEFAFFDPSPARNPHDTDYTPGGSSSGSGAAVAAGCVPMALGTQTVASVNRPAAYCGVAAFKPTTRSLSSHGTSPLAPSYDTIGFFGADVDDAVYAYESITPFGPAPAAAPVRPAERGRIVFVENDLIADAEPAMARAVEVQLDNFEHAGFRVERIASPVSLTRLYAIHKATMCFETGRVLAHLDQYPEGEIGPYIREAVAKGKQIAPEDYLAQRAEMNALRRSFFAAFEPSDVFFWPATPGPAPRGLESTGDPKYIAPWTSLGGPIVSLPLGAAANGLPLGATLSAFPNTDRATGVIARELARVTG